jgi:hypothetical protein
MIACVVGKSTVYIAVVGLCGGLHSICFLLDKQI